MFLCFTFPNFKTNSVNKTNRDSSDTATLRVQSVLQRPQSDTIVQTIFAPPHGSRTTFLKLMQVFFPVHISVRHLVLSSRCPVLQQPNIKQKFVALLKRFKVTDEVRVCFPVRLKVDSDSFHCRHAEMETAGIFRLILLQGGSQTRRPPASGSFSEPVLLF